MENRALFERIYARILGNVSMQETDGGFIVTLPYNDFMGDPIEVFVGRRNGQITLEDLGRSAGCLFSLGQHTEAAPGHQLLKKLANAYGITMDYSHGTLFKEVSPEVDASDVLAFIRVLIALQTVMPAMQPRTKEKRGSRLASRLSQDIKQLRLPSIYVQRQTLVTGKSATWKVTYKYSLERDVLIVAADLSRREPIDKAAHVVAMAIDIRDTGIDRLFRVVYHVNGSGPEARQAADLINDNQQRFHYRAFDYANQFQKQEFAAITQQELSAVSSRRAPLL